MTMKMTISTTILIIMTISMNLMSTIKIFEIEN